MEENCKDEAQLGQGILTKSMSVADAVTNIEPTGSYSDFVTSYKVLSNFGACMFASVIVIRTMA